MTNKAKGILFLVGPIVLLAVILMGYAISSFVMAQSYRQEILQTTNSTTTFGLNNPNELGLAKHDLRTTTASIIRVSLGFLGIIAVLLIFVGIPLGIYFLSKKDLTENNLSALQNDDKYKNLTPEQITYIHKFSWGAFIASGIWPWGNKLYLWGILAFIPLIGIYVWIRLAIEGRKLAWEQGGWTNFEQFKNRQKIMAWIILAIIILAFLGNLS
ncbi:MAG: hypothetical protein US42_C0009G0035 [Candidatus Magasanikbacteria bacterium GW2011_GWC2_37_14]|uniref:Uncharacterized protein n=1 Tax=Candidatus Magasanikbacteria bacterium GW2011_GWC2_37_14 TaxID=1619046 RepID=A0A0G0GMR2_9BACT|nr:MAG: hypothetical protein US42_C0009G0035 [Candidatus Magasanikbacteria bacterium GW2011_GWC2_37_14]